MRIIFAGTAEFAERALSALVDAGHEVAMVLTQPDRPAGRGLRPGESPVKQLARARKLEVYQPATLGDETSLARLRGVHADALVVAAYGLILPQTVLDLAPRGAFNIHASLLPRWRGAAPIQRAMLAGDRETGITIMKMDAGLDTGPTMAQRRIAIDDDDDARTLHDKLAVLGAEMIVGALAEIEAGRAQFIPQPATGASYARKLEKSEMQLDWSRSCVELERAVRAFRPAPGAQSVLRGERVKIWHAHCADAQGEPGTVLAASANGVLIACGSGALAVTELQRAGGKRLAVTDFLHGCPIGRGERFGATR
jgi:methionyl-tRNA formyltransferase